jgi:hypothetical protein
VLRPPALLLLLVVGDGVALVLVLACDVDVGEDALVSVDAAVLEEVVVDDADFCSHSIGDHEACATALNVSVGRGGLISPQPPLPQHSQTCAVVFHRIHLWVSSAI